VNAHGRFGVQALACPAQVQPEGRTRNLRPPWRKIWPVCALFAARGPSERSSYRPVSHGRDARATMASWHGRPGHAKLDRSV